MAKQENKPVESTEFVNPWVKGVSYKDFEKALNGKTPKEYLTGKLGVENEKELIEWLTNDLEIYKNNIKNK